MKEHKETLMFCIISLLGNLLPLILGVLFYAVQDQTVSDWKVFYSDGQFYLYSASLLTASAYIFYTYKIRNTDFTSILLLITGLLILFVSVLYAWKLSGSNNNVSVVAYTSILVFVITVGLYYYANFLSNKKIDVIGAQKRGVEEILKAL